MLNWMIYLIITKKFSDMNDNKNNNITNNDAVGGVLGTGKRTNIIEQLLITYNRNF